MVKQKRATSTAKAADNQKSKSKTNSKKRVKTTKANKVSAQKTKLKIDKFKVGKKSSKKNSKETFDRLNLWNWILAGLHTVQAFAVMFLSKPDSLFPVTTQYITVDELASSADAPVLVSAVRSLGSVNLAYLVAGFFLMSAIAHLAVATVYRSRYQKDLKNNVNKIRWIEYSLSASTMMLGIAMLAGVSDLSTLVMIFLASAVMNLCGLVMEVTNKAGKKPQWLSYIVGTIAGLAPWVAVGIYLYGSSIYGGGNVPTFVYYIYGSIFVFFSSFAVNMWLQYRGKGKWQDYLYGEKSYMLLSLLAKSALAWQVFFGTLRP